MMTVVRNAALSAVVFILGTAAAPAADAPAPAPAAAPAVPADGAARRLDQAYGLIDKADQAWREAGWEQAEDLYAGALGLLESLETDYPGWSTLVVRGRILACRSAIEKIQARKPPQAPAPAEGDEPEAAADIPFAVSAASAETASKALREGIEERDETIRGLREENRGLREESRKLAERLAKLEGRKKDKGAAAIPAPAVIPRVLKGEARRMMEAAAYTNAIPLLEEMKGLYPEDKGIGQLLGIAYCRNGQFEQALVEVEPMAKQKPVPADVWMTLGVAYLGLGKLGESREAFEKALEIEPNLPEAHFNMSQILIRLKKPQADLARRHYMAAIQLGAKRDTELEYVINQALLFEQAGKLKK